MVPPPLSEKPDIENVYIFVSDALRWASLPTELEGYGRTFKTVASGCATMKAVSSILSGLNPPRHGVQTWRDKLTQRTVFDIPGVTAGFANPAAGESGGLSVVLDHDGGDDVASVETPFVFLERDQGGHAPYADYSYQEMITSLDHDHSELLEHYEREVERSVERFDERLDTLKDRGILDDTLVVFLGDHGELLGEYGTVSHTSPPVPELVYVPTIFVHPDLPSGVADQTIGHVDLAPTIFSAMDADARESSFDGVDLFESVPGPRYNDANHHQQIGGKRRALYLASGMWDGDGGHVFTHRGKPIAPLIGLLKAKGWNRAYWRSNPREIPRAMSRYVKPHYEYGDPDVTRQEAAEQVEKIRSEEGTSDDAEIDDDVQQQLADLGYRT